jgi:DNA-binding response OmpR family regulator
MAKSRVLILEDDRWLADSLATILRADFDVKVANDPETVFATMDDWWPDVLLADVILGAKNLFVLLNEMQSYTDTSCVNVVILSTISSQLNSRDVENFNVRAVLDKAAITPESLRETLTQIVAKTNRKRGAK